MKKFKKALVLFLCAVLLVAGSVAGTLAYLLAKSDVVQNTFTYGDIEITLDEADVKPDGTLESENRVQANEYHLIPSHTYVKDPTVTVLEDSEPCYVRMKVYVANLDNLMTAIPVADHPEFYGADGVFLLQKLVGGWDNATWNYVKFDSTTNTYEFRYPTIVGLNSEDDTKLPPLFTSITVPGFIDNDNLPLMGSVQINVSAEAIQADGFEGDANAAWTAFDAQA